MAPTLAQELRGRFVVVNLGAGADSDYPLPAAFQKAMTLIEIEGGRVNPITSEKYFAKHTVGKVIAGSSEHRRFNQYAWWGGGGIYEPIPEMIKLYGLDNFYKVLSVSDVETETVPQLLDSLAIETIDFLKTDIEGADFEVIKSCENLLPRVLMLQCELRFQPFYVGEPRFHEVDKYLHEHGFELIDMLPDRWKPNTTNRNRWKDGRLVWADCLYAKAPEAIIKFQNDEIPLAFAKQILIANMLGLNSHAEYLLESYAAKVLPADWLKELRYTFKVLHNPFWERLKALIQASPLDFLYRRLRKLMFKYDFPHVVK
ncbi:MAG: FkbM family methyltransferase [Kiritimatiellae bacterium]|nr:FkbM family methyltransferase [Kiritimatiellia bacterium]